ncbi:hypothetical protein D3C81_1297130 [compost metagenome]
MIISLRVAIAKSYAISGFGLAIAKTIGLGAIDNNISADMTSAADNPINTSESFTASARVWISRSVAYCAFILSRFSLSVRITPLLSSITMFSLLAPTEIYIAVQDIAAAPAPLTTIFTLEISFPIISQALIKAAPEMIAVPC